MRKMPFVIALVILALGSACYKRAPQEALAPSTVNPDDFRMTVQYIRDKYVKTEINEEDLFYGSIKGLVDGLKDPYSQFFDPRETRLFKDRMTGSFAGIGVEIGIKDERITVIAPIDDLPAAKAGIRAGDVIWMVNGAKTAGKTIDEVILMIRGDKGKPVTLSIMRTGFSEPKDFVVVRDIVVIVPVKWSVKTVDQKRVMVIRVSQFSANAAEYFDRAAREAVIAKADGIVLDLRNNPGGLMHIAGKVACAWRNDLPYVIVEERGRSVRKDACDVRPILNGVPTVVLINKGSASASEITAGALQDFGQARLIGETSYGKGCGQGMYSLPDGAMVKLTNMYWKTPKGRLIHQIGLTPDETLKADPEDFAKGKDVQLDRALEYLTKAR
jgi:carboxyl-terminal processing protease